MRQSRLVTGVAVVTAVAAGGVGGALIGVPALSGAQPFSKIATSTAASDGTKPAWHIRGDSALLDAAAKEYQAAKTATPGTSTPPPSTQPGG